MRRPERRSLTNVGGDVDLGGDPEAAALLARALTVPPPPPKSDRATEGVDRAHVHGFHAYPARMHPLTASRLVDAFIPKGGTVLDPFCGSGTVLVEAMLLSRNAVGTDLNPLAVGLAQVKTKARAEGELAALQHAAQTVAAFAEERRRARAGATRRFSKDDTTTFDPHVLLELDSLRHGIRTLAPEAHQDDLMFVLSSILVKVSRKESDTSTREEPKRIAAGYPTRLLVKKTEELIARLRELEARLPSPRPEATCLLDDATRLDELADACVDGIVTSPPYVATYDYLAHHALRLRWLGLDATDFEENEVGARRAYTDLTPRVAYERWAAELHALLVAAARVTRRDGAVVLLMADSAVADAPLPADEIIADVAQSTPLVCVARASQLREHFHPGTREAFRLRSRAEHALLLRRS